MILLLDNYDSFTFNLYQLLRELGAEVEVARNDRLSLADIEGMMPDLDRIVISPGPCTPAEAGISVPLVKRFAGRVPILGVCLGHQAIGAAFGSRIVPAPVLMHGKTSLIHHRGTGVFAGLPNPFIATRYHSLIIERASYRELEVEGVQFHPESILTTAGRDLLANFIGRRAADIPARVPEVAAIGY
jgi:anthranilate synthase component 2